MKPNAKFKLLTSIELLKSIPGARHEWHSKSPFEKWCYLYNFGKAPCDWVHMPLFRETADDVHWFGYFGFTYMIVQTTLSIYTLHFYTARGQLQMGLPCTCLLGIMIGHIPLLMAMVSKPRHKLLALLNYGGKYIYQDNSEQTEYNRICSEQLDKTAKSHIIKMGAIWISYICAIFNPTYEYFTYGTKATTPELHWPFCEPKSNGEFMANLLLQNVVAVHAIILYFIAEIMLSLYANVVTVSPRLIKSDLTRTIQLHQRQSITKLELYWRIRNIVIQSHDLDDYLADLSKVFYWRNLFNSSAWAYMIGMSIYCQYTMNFACGYGMACMQLVQWFYVCDVGETIQDNGFTEALYDVEWENLPLDVQKIIALLIHRKQNESGLKLGPFGFGLNRATFKLTTNRIYSFLMFLLNFFD